MILQERTEKRGFLSLKQLIFRRRKMLVDQLKQQKEIEVRKFEESQVHKFREQALKVANDKNY
jgi:hypothetical protein